MARVITALVLSSDTSKVMSELDEFLLSEDVASRLGLSRSTVQEWMWRGLLPHRKLPGTRRCLVTRADFEAWLAGAELEDEAAATRRSHRKAEIGLGATRHRLYPILYLHRSNIAAMPLIPLRCRQTLSRMLTSRRPFRFPLISMVRRGAGLL
jgi:excisionase family DNA binding protein